MATILLKANILAFHTLNRKEMQLTFADLAKVRAYDLSLLSISKHFSRKTNPPNLENRR